MRHRPIWYIPRPTVEYKADAYFIGLGWMIRYQDGETKRWTWVHRLYWSNHFDRI